jgi:hypothetical protein
LTFVHRRVLICLDLAWYQETARSMKTTKVANDVAMLGATGTFDATADDRRAKAEEVPAPW